MDQELVQYLDGRFQYLDERFERIEQRLDGHDRRFDDVNDRIEEAKRHSGVLVEGLRHEIHLVAEGLTMHIQVQHVQEREYHERQHQETRALLRLSYEQLHQRVENLERNRPS